MEASDTRVDSSEQDASVNNELETTSEQSNEISVPVDSFNRSDINLHENTRDIDKSKMDNYTENLGANKEICESLYNYSDLNDLTWNYFEIVNKNSIYFNTNTDTNQRFQNERNGSGGLIIRNKFNISTGDKIPQELHQLFDSFPMYTYIPGTIDTKLQLLKKNILSEQPNHSDIDETILSSSSVPITNENNNKHLLYTPFEIGLEVFDDEQVDENTGKSLVLPDSNWVEDRIFGNCIEDSFENKIFFNDWYNSLRTVFLNNIEVLDYTTKINRRLRWGQRNGFNISKNRLNYASGSNTPLYLENGKYISEFFFLKKIINDNYKLPICSNYGLPINEKRINAFRKQIIIDLNNLFTNTYEFLSGINARHLMNLNLPKDMIDSLLYGDEFSSPRDMLSEYLWQLFHRAEDMEIYLVIKLPELTSPIEINCRDFYNRDEDGVFDKLKQNDLDTTISFKDSNKITAHCDFTSQLKKIGTHIGSERKRIDIMDINSTINLFEENKLLARIFHWNNGSFRGETDNFINGNHSKLSDTIPNNPPMQIYKLDSYFYKNKIRFTDFHKKNKLLKKYQKKVNNHSRLYDILFDKYFHLFRLLSNWSDCFRKDNLHLDRTNLIKEGDVERIVLYPPELSDFDSCNQNRSKEKDAIKYIDRINEYIIAEIGEMCTNSMTDEGQICSMDLIDSAEKLGVKTNIINELRELIIIFTESYNDTNKKKNLQLNEKNWSVELTGLWKQTYQLFYKKIKNIEEIDDPELSKINALVRQYGLSKKTLILLCYLENSLLLGQPFITEFSIPTFKLFFPQDEFKHVWNKALPGFSWNYNFPKMDLDNNNPVNNKTLYHFPKIYYLTIYRLIIQNKIN